MQLLVLAVGVVLAGLNWQRVLVFLYCLRTEELVKVGTSVCMDVLLR